MPRAARRAPGGTIFRALNRSNHRERLFTKDRGYLTFLQALCDTLEKKSMCILAYCLMPNHWHLPLWPKGYEDLGAFMQAVTTTQVRRWRTHRYNVGDGHLHQATYKSFPVQNDEHFHTVCRYVERNALRADLVKRAEDWRWGSLWQREQRERIWGYPRLTEWPVPCPRQWATVVNRPETPAELEALRASVNRGRRFGAAACQQRIGKRLGLEYTFRPRGRPRKSS